MSAVRIKCLKCKVEEDFEKYTLLEGALLVCPNCEAEFSLTATLEQLPGDDEAGDDFGMEEPSPELPDLPSASSPATAAPAGAEEFPALPSGESQLQREPVIEVHVLACSECNASWVGTHARTCPSCRSGKVMRTDRTVQERALEAVDEIERGVPIERALAKMTGKFRKAPRRARVRR